MQVYRWNGEYWYCDRRSLWKTLRQWVIWVGGWEQSNGSGWNFSLPPTPISILGHRLTFYGHWGQVRTPWGILVVNPREREAYISRDGTPGKAHVWLYGAPRFIREQVNRHEAQRAMSQREN